MRPLGWLSKRHCFVFIWPGYVNEKAKCRSRLIFVCSGVPQRLRWNAGPGRTSFAADRPARQARQEAVDADGRKAEARGASGDLAGAHGIVAIPALTTSAYGESPDPAHLPAGSPKPPRAQLHHQAAIPHGGMGPSNQQNGFGRAAPRPPSGRGGCISKISDRPGRHVTARPPFEPDAVRGARCRAVTAISEPWGNHEMPARPGGPLRDRAALRRTAGICVRCHPELTWGCDL